MECLNKLIHVKYLSMLANLPVLFPSFPLLSEQHVARIVRVFHLRIGGIGKILNLHKITQK